MEQDQHCYMVIFVVNPFHIIVSFKNLLSIMYISIIVSLITTIGDSKVKRACQRHPSALLRFHSGCGSHKQSQILDLLSDILSSPFALLFLVSKMPLENNF